MCVKINNIILILLWFYNNIVLKCFKSKICKIYLDFWFEYVFILPGYLFNSKLFTSGEPVPSALRIKSSEDRIPPPPNVFHGYVVATDEEAN